MTSPTTYPNILVLEDDVDQMDLLVDFALSEIKSLIDDESTSEEHKEKLKNIRVLKTSNIRSLQRAVSIHKDVLLAVLDCNTPDDKGGKAHDQLVKTNHKITGQHRSVDIVTEHLPDTPITMISSSDRFRTIVNRHYESKHNLSINFIGKRDALRIRKNIEYFLKRFLAA